MTIKKPAVTLLEMLLVLIIVAGVSFFSYVAHAKSIKNEQIHFWQTLDLEIRYAQHHVKLNDSFIIFLFDRRELVISDNKHHLKVIKYPSTIYLQNRQTETVIFNKQQQMTTNIIIDVIENGVIKDYKISLGLEWGAYTIEPTPTGLYSY